MTAPEHPPESRPETWPETWPQIWIDARSDRPAPRLFGLDPVERARRALAQARLPADRLRVSTEPGAAGPRLARHLRSASGPVLAFDAAALTDPRLLARLAREAAPRVAREEEGAVLLLRPEDAERAPRDARDLAEVADALLAKGAPRFGQEDFDGFVGMLRRDLPFHIRRVRSEAEARRVERWLFWANYKGSTDILTRWVFPPLVWPITRACARHGVHPNVVTWVSVLLTALAAWAFASGALWTGLACAYAMAVLDSVDGKLARVTLTDSRFGEVLDHGLDIVHPPFWWLAWAWGLVSLGADPIVWSAAWAMVGFYILDRLVLMAAKRRFGRGLHAMTPLDARVRSVISRRNVNLLILTIGLAFGANIGAFLVVTAWQAATALWHAARTALLWPKGRA